MSAEDGRRPVVARMTQHTAEWDEMVCVGCGATVLDDGTDAILGWIGGDEGWFCPDEPSDDEPSTPPGSVGS